MLFVFSDLTKVNSTMYKEVLSVPTIFSLGNVRLGWFFSINLRNGHWSSLGIFKLLGMLKIWVARELALMPKTSKPILTTIQEK